MFFNNYLSSYFVFFSSGKNLSIPILTFVGILIEPVLSTMFSVVGNKKNFSKSLYLFFFVKKELCTNYLVQQLL